MSNGQLNTIQPQGLQSQMQQSLTRDQIDLIKTTIAKGSTDDELKLFVQTCNRTGLDPFARQVFAVKRYDSKAGKEVMAIQVSIDGFRLISERSGKYAGQIGPYWTNDGKTWLEVWLDSTPPKAAKVGILRSDFKEPLWAVATWDQYSQKTKDGRPSGLWGKMGPLMLAKCAESLARRTAFPQELSGLYTADEMGQAENTEPAATPQPRAKVKELAPVDASPVVDVEPEGTTWTEDEVKRAFALLDEIKDAFFALGYGDKWPGYFAKKQADMQASDPAAMIPALERESLTCKAKVEAAKPKVVEPEMPPMPGDDAPFSGPSAATPGDEGFALQAGAEDVDAAQGIPAEELNDVMGLYWTRIQEVMAKNGDKPQKISQTKAKLLSTWTVGIRPDDTEAFERAVVRGQMAWVEAHA